MIPSPNHLVHRALVAMHGLHHVSDDRGEDLARVLRVAIGNQLHRALEIGERDGHVLPFAFDDTFGCQDLLGEVLGIRTQATRHVLRRPWRVVTHTARRTCCPRHWPCRVFGSATRSPLRTGHRTSCPPGSQYRTGDTASSRSAPITWRSSRHAPWAHRQRHAHGVNHPRSAPKSVGCAQGPALPVWPRD